jgi:hypothetical protein
VRQDEAIKRLWILGEETDLGMKKSGENLKEPDSHYMEGKAIKLTFFHSPTASKIFRTRSHRFFPTIYQCSLGMIPSWHRWARSSGPDAIFSYES